jgi:hypothetical protein
MRSCVVGRCSIVAVAVAAVVVVVVVVEELGWVLRSGVDGRGRRRRRMCGGGGCSFVGVSCVMLGRWSICFVAVRLVRTRRWVGVAAVVEEGSMLASALGWALSGRAVDVAGRGIAGRGIAVGVDTRLETRCKTC